MAVDENGTVTLSEARARAHATPAEPIFLLVELDAAVDSLKEKIEENKQDLVFYKEEMARTVKELEALQHATKELARKVAREEGEVAQAEAGKKQYDQRLMKIVSPKELEALQHEIAQQAAAIATREAAVLALYEEQESQGKALAELRTKAERMTKAVEKKTADKHVENARLALEITRLQERRGDYVVKLEPAIAARYEKAHSAHGGVVAYTIDDNGCGGCGWTAPVSEFNRLRQNPGKPFDCGHCGRLLVWVGAKGD